MTKEQEYQKEYRLKNKDKLTEFNKIYVKLNKEKLANYKREYYLKNIEMNGETINLKMICYLNYHTIQEQ